MGRFGMPSSVVQHEAFIVNRLATSNTAIRGLVSKTSVTLGQVERFELLFLYRFEVRQLVEVGVQSFSCAFLPLELESALQTDANEKLQVVSQASHECKKLLSYSKLPHTRLLGFR